MGSLAGPKRWNRAKLEAYECGIEPTVQPSGLRFPVKYYLTAMLFIVFDIEIIFLYPWAVAFDRLGAFGLTTTLSAQTFSGAAALDRVIDQAIEQGRMPGAVLLVGHEGKRSEEHTSELQSL